MDARPVLFRIARLLAEHRLEAVLIGNAAAALQGAPVTTVDFDFLFRKTPANLKKLKSMAAELRAMVLRPYYPVSGLYRIVRDEDGLQIGFMSVIDGISSFNGLWKRARRISFGAFPLHVATLPDIIRSKKAAAWPRDRAVLAVLEQTLAETARHEKAETGRSPQESELALRDQIRRLLALPPEKRTHFLRKRVSIRMSCL